MKHDNNNPRTIDDAIRAVRGDVAPANEVNAAGDRVWAKISGAQPVSHSERISGCEDIQSLLPAFSSSALSSERMLIVEDHLNGCVACRHALNNDAARVPALWAQQPSPSLKTNFWDMRQLAVAAMLFVVVGISGYFVNRYFAPLPGNRGTVQSATGGVFLLAANSERPLLPGHELSEGDVIRTGSGSHAVVRLFDGSVVEMNERAEFSVAARRSATTIHLGRGHIIVQAAKQHGHLFVATDACKVSVTGTVFAVDSGIKGSRVSVIEGEVHVDENGIDNVLHSGDQITTSDSMGEVPIEADIAWSQNRESHLALLAEFSKLQKKLENVETPGLRYESAILHIAPEQTIIYASIPNFGEAIGEANRLFQDQVKQSDVLRQWWYSNGLGKQDPKFQEMVERIRTLGQFLGNEIVFMLVPAGNGKGPAMIVAAQVTRPGLREFLQSELERSEMTPERKERITIVDEPGAVAGVTSQKGNIAIMAGKELLLASIDGQALQNFAARRAEGGNTGFAESSFGQAIAASYQEGAGLLFAADLEKMIAHQELESLKSGQQPKHMAVLQQSGFGQARFLVVKRRDESGQPDNRATMTFNAQRSGLASWLAAPSGMGSLDFVSPDATVVAAATMKSPAAMLDDVFSLMSSSGKNSDAARAEFQAEMNFDLREELAATLGGDFAIAMDGPILPTPSWKFVIEVNDQSKLQSTLQKLVQDVNAKALQHNRPGFSLNQVEEDGRIFYTVSSATSPIPLEIHYTFVSGYLVAAPSQALVTKAIRIRESGITLTRSTGFKSLLPKDRHTDASGLIYQNLASIAGPLSEQLNPNEAQSLQTIAANARPSLICAYGDDNSIEIATASKFFGFDVNNLALSQLLRLAPGTRTTPNP
ncbi:MAG: putative FecR [Candidatus Angelobacter sp.]|jgi:hypothetical protein|nr:putative FecR [Candidatus Angelobacter sp.]